MKDIKETIARISGHRHRRGYAVLICAVQAAHKYQPREPQMNAIQKDVAAMMGGGRTPTAVSRNLARVTVDIWEHGDRQELSKVYGHPVQDRPTPKELVLRLAEYVWEEKDARPRKVTYRWWKSLSGLGYGVAAVVRDPAYHAVTGPLCGDFARIQRLVERLNAEQLPLAEFEERYLNGSLLEWLNCR